MTEYTQTNRGPRYAGDPPADAVARTILAEDEAGRRLNAAWHESIGRTPPGASPGPETELDRELTGHLLSEKEREHLRNAQRFFAVWGPLLGASYLLCALPSTYAAARGVQTIFHTGRLQTDPKRRVIETCGLLIDLMRPQQQGLDARSLETIRRVRLMHAYVRVLLSEGTWHDPSIPRPPRSRRGLRERAAQWAKQIGSSTWRSLPSVRQRQTPGAWSEAWGLPLNQDDLAATLMAFAYLPLSSLNAEEPPIAYDPGLADDWVCAWSIIGRLLGIDESVVGALPTNLAEAGARWEEFAAREFGWSAAGREMVHALIRSVERDIPGRFLDPLVHEMFYRQLSTRPAGSLRPTAAEALRLRRRTVWKYVYTGLRLTLRSLRLQEAILSTGTAAHEGFGYDVFHWVVTSSSEYRQRPFALPVELCEIWDWPAEGSKVLRPRLRMGITNRPFSQDRRVKLAQCQERQARAEAAWASSER